MMTGDKKKERETLDRRNEEERKSAVLLIA
jgi:hypothetical protein